MKYFEPRKRQIFGSPRLLLGGRCHISHMRKCPRVEPGGRLIYVQFTYSILSSNDIFLFTPYLLYKALTNLLFANGEFQKQTNLGGITSAYFNYGQCHRITTAVESNVQWIDLQQDLVWNHSPMEYWCVAVTTMASAVRVESVAITGKGRLVVKRRPFGMGLSPLGKAIVLAGFRDVVTKWLRLYMNKA